MIFNQANIDRTCPEKEIYNKVLSLDDKHILELGCGAAEITRDIASNGKNRVITAFEVDQIQHKKNLQITDLANVSFQSGGAENIPVDDNSQDIVFMFKSLHHVPNDLLDKAMKEINRVLVPGGFAYISEPIFAGDFNEIIRLFHDEQQVRIAAFKATQRAVDAELFNLHQEIFFNVTVNFEGFAEFEEKLLNVTHTEHHLSKELHDSVKSKFEFTFSQNGGQFTAPMRVDLLQSSK
jgi:ubiquinone/menaquinone biosynthesis C-methylase UbiE